MLNEVIERVRVDNGYMSQPITAAIVPSFLIGTSTDDNGRRRPDFLFISRTGVRRTLWTIRVAIQRSMLRHLGVRITPHQFRHIAAKIHLDANPGAYELVRQLLGHKDLKTTTKFYAGIDTRRAGRAHAQLVARLRAARPERVRRRPKTPQDPQE